MKSLVTFAALCLATSGCSSSSMRGYPTLVAACQTTADCAAVGAAFRCVAGACAILSCQCDDSCPAELACFVAPGNPGGECLALPRTKACDAGVGDGGVGDGG